MEAPGQEYLFLGERLGMVYGVQGGKVTIIGLDSNVYQQSSHVVLPTNSTKLGVAEEEVDNEERKKYKDAISILPAAPEPEPEPGSAPGPDISNDTVVGTSVKLEKSESTKMTAAEMLSAIANFEDGPDEDQPPLDPAATDVQHAPDQNHQGASVDPATSPHPEGAAGASHGFADNVVTSDSYEDFQSTLHASSLSAKYSPRDQPEAGDLHGISIPSEIPEGSEDTSNELDSPFGTHSTPADTPTSPSPAPPYEQPPPHVSDTAAPVQQHERGEGVQSGPVLSLTPPTGQALQHPQPSGVTEAVAGYSTLDTEPTPQPGVDPMSARKVARLFGTPSIVVSSPAAVDDPTEALQAHTRWTVLRASADLFLLHTVDRVNGVRMRELDGAFQLALIKQRHRPLAIRFRTPRNALPQSQASGGGVENSVTGGSGTEGSERSTRSRSSTPTSHLAPTAPLPPPPAEKFKYTLFMAKYTSTAAAKIRSTVDSTLQDYVSCDWAAVKAAGEGSPQATIVSIYKYIEHEMTKLELFNHTHARGYGVPAVLEESHWEDIRNHIETLVFRAVGSFTRTLWPIFSEDSGFDFVDTDAVVSDLKANTLIGVDLNVTSLDATTTEGGTPEQSRNTDASPLGPDTDGPEPTVELSRDHPLRMKLAFLRFVTLESTGLDCGTRKVRANSMPEGDHPTVSTSHGSHLSAEKRRTMTIAVVEKMRRINRAMLHREEWYLAMRGLCRSLQLETPGEVLRALATTVKLISHALDVYLRNYPEPVDGAEEGSDDLGGGTEAAVVATAAVACTSGLPSLVCACGAVHLQTPANDYTVHRDTVLAEEVDVTPPSTEGATASASERSALTPEQDDNSDAFLFTPKRLQPETLTTVVNELLQGRRVLQSCTEKTKREHRILSADDLMPALTYVLIQANPPNIEYVVWMCSEFRNPALLRGEEAFCLAQLSSAVEFCKHADHRAFDIPHSIYNACMLGYTSTLKLLVACKTGDLPQVKELVENQYANVNGLSPDHKDSPLTACIRFGRHAILRYLLSIPTVDVNLPVQLFHGPDQRTSPLILATHYNQLEMVIDLLVAGADRYYYNDSGATALSIATAADLPLLRMVLETDPASVDLVQSILDGDRPRSIALLLQRVDVNYLAYPTRTHSPLIAAVLMRDFCILRLLMTRQLCQIDVDLRNAQGHTALIVCALEFTRIPCVDYLHIAAMLLRYGADRYIADHTGRTALDIIKESREALRAVERELQNPFQSTDGADGLLTPPGASPRDEMYRLNPFLMEREDDALPTPRAPPLPPTPPPQPVPEPSAPPSAAPHVRPVSAAVVTAPAKARLSLAPPPPTSPPPAPPVAESQAPTAPPPPFKVNMEHKQLLKDFALLLANDPLSLSIPPIYELSRDRRLHDVRSLLLQGVDVNAMCPQKAYTALIAAVYNSDLPMVKLLLRSDELCRNTYFSIQFSILSAIKSAIKGTEELVEADAELRVNEEGVVEGEPDGYLRRVDNTEKEYLSTPNTPTPRKHNRLLRRGAGDASIQPAATPATAVPAMRFAGKTNTVDLDAAGRNGMRALHYASQIGDIRIVGALLQAGANREVFNNKLHTPLDVCVANGHIAAANAIRFDPERVSICLAAKHGDWAVMQALLCQGVSINTQRNHLNKTTEALQHELYTPLLAAVAHGQHEIVKHILNVPDVDVNLTNLHNQTALMFAAARGDENTVLLLLSRGADRWVLDNQGYIAREWAESRKRDAIVTILKHDPSRVWIHDVIRNNDFNGVIAMLKQKVDVNLRRYTKHVPHSPATTAVAKLDSVGSPPERKAFNTATPDRRRGSATKESTKSTASLGAATPGGEEVLGSSTGSGSFIHGETPLIVAARYNRLDVIAILLKAPAPNAADVNLPDSSGNTPLHHAAVKGHEEAVLILLKAHASRHARNLLGLPANLVAKSAGFQHIAAIIEADPYLIHIHDTCQMGDVKMTVALLKQGCPPNYRDERAMKRQQTPLMAAASGGQVDVARMLLKIEEVVQGIDLQDTQGRTALMRAAAVGALNVTALLLNAGCDRTLKDHDGLTAQDHASKHSYTVKFQFFGQSMVR